MICITIIDIDNNEKKNYMAGPNANPMFSATVEGMTVNKCLLKIFYLIKYLYICCFQLEIISACCFCCIF
jgi:hypothetical protein